MLAVVAALVFVGARTYAGVYLSFGGGGRGRRGSVHFRIGHRGRPIQRYARRRSYQPRPVRYVRYEPRRRQTYYPRYRRPVVVRPYYRQPTYTYGPAPCGHASLCACRHEMGYWAYVPVRDWDGYYRYRWVWVAR